MGIKKTVRRVNAELVLTSCTKKLSAIIKVLSGL